MSARHWIIGLCVSAALTACTTPAGGPLLRRGVVPPGRAEPPSQPMPTEDLDLQIALGGDSYSLGEPVYLTLRLRNTGSESLRVFGSLDPTDGATEVLVRLAGAPWSSFVPLVEVDNDDGIFTSLDVGEVLGNVAAIFFGAPGWTFAEPGDYQVKAIFQTSGSDGRTLQVTSPTLELEIRPSAAGTLLVGSDLASVEAGKFLTWRAGDHLEAGQALLRQVLETDERSPLSDHIHSAFAHSQGEAFSDYRQGRVRAPDCDRAIAHLDAVVSDRLPEHVRLENTIMRGKCASRHGAPGAARRYFDEAREMARGKPEYRGTRARIDRLRGRLDAGNKGPGAPR